MHDDLIQVLAGIHSVNHLKNVSGSESSFLRRQESTFYFESDSGEIAQFQQ